MKACRRKYIEWGAAGIGALALFLFFFRISVSYTHLHLFFPSSCSSAFPVKLLSIFTAPPLSLIHIYLNFDPVKEGVIGADDEPVFTFTFPDRETTGPATTAVPMNTTPATQHFIDRLMLQKGSGTDVYKRQALHAATVLSTIVVLWSEVWRLLKGLFSRRFNAEQAYCLLYTSCRVMVCFSAHSLCSTSPSQSAAIDPQTCVTRSN